MTSFRLGNLGWLACAALLLSACNSAQTRASEAYAEYQAAVAAEDLPAARRALLALVTAQEDVPDHWVELAKVQLTLGAYNDAYYALVRAHELDRTDGNVLTLLTRMALLNGSLDMAEQYARKLEFIAPSDPVVSLTYGYIALRRGDLDAADERAARVLEAAPFDSNAKILSARILVARQRSDEAVALLQEQIRVQPDDRGALRALASIHERRNDWASVADVASTLLRLDPKDRGLILTYIQAALRSSNLDAARAATVPLLVPETPPALIESILMTWAGSGSGKHPIEDPRRLAAAAGPNQQFAYAVYFNRVGRPAEAAALVRASAQLPVTSANASANAIYAEALSVAGRNAEAKQRFDAVLAREPDHVHALRGRAALELKMGSAKGALRDAQRLISIVPDSARDRLLLADIYAALGDHRQVDRTIWEGFHAIPANPAIFERLRMRVARAGDPDAVRRVVAEYEQQRDTKLTKEFI